MNTKSLEAIPANAVVAISTPKELDYDSIVRDAAKRKVDNGAQFSSTKGKSSLQIAVNNILYSMLSIPKFDENGKANSLPNDVFQKGKAAIERFWFNEAKSMVDDAIANDAKINIRRGVLMSRVDSKGKIQRTKTDKATFTHVAKAFEHRLCDTVGLVSAQKRLDEMLDNVGKWSREELQTQRNKIIALENALKENKA